MAEPQVLACPSCQKKMRIPETHFGKKIKCPGCQTVLRIAADGSAMGVAQLSQKVAQPAGVAAAAARPAGASASQAKAAAKPASRRAAAAAAPAKPAEKKKLGGKGKAEIAVSGGAKRAGKGSLKPAKEVKKKAKVDSSRMRVGAKLQRRSVKGRAEALEGSEGALGKYAGVMLIGLIVVAAGSMIVISVLGLGPQDPGRVTPEVFNILPKEEVKLEELGRRQVPDPFAAPGEDDTFSVVVYKRNTDDMEFVKIPGGTYTVGSAEPTYLRHGEPEVQGVQIGDFYIGRYEVTVEQYRKFTTWLLTIQKKQAEVKKYLESQREILERLGANDLIARLETEEAMYDRNVFNHPMQPSRKTGHEPEGFYDIDVEQKQPAFVIDWWDAYAYCNWANCMEYGRGILPTEIEWEVAARGLDPDDNPGGLLPWIGAEDEASLRAVALEQYGQFNENETPLTHAVPSGPFNDTENERELYTRTANRYGVYDAWGNAAEWVWDYFDPDFYIHLAEALAENPDLEDYYVSGDRYEQWNDDADLVSAERGVRTFGYKAFDTVNEIEQASFVLRHGRRPTPLDDELDKNMGFRCVFYAKDMRDAPYTAELKAVYDAMEDESASATSGDGDGDGRFAQALSCRPSARRERDLRDVLATLDRNADEADNDA